MVYPSAYQAELAAIPLDDPKLEDTIGSNLYAKLLEDVELLDGVIPELDREMVSTSVT